MYVRTKRAMPIYIKYRQNTVTWFMNSSAVVCPDTKLLRMVMKFPKTRLTRAKAAPEAIAAMNAMISRATSTGRAYAKIRYG